MGTERQGLSTCRQTNRGGTTSAGCEDVPVYSLDSYLAQHHDDADDSSTINYLSIDVEGYDYDVLLGARNHTLRRVEYLELEYNWMGSWQHQALYDLIRMLDDDFNMTCYWPGTAGRLWRITDCWLPHYALHFWSNVACVSRRHAAVAPMARRMEGLFLATLQQGQDARVSNDPFRQARDKK